MRRAILVAAPVAAAAAFVGVFVFAAVQAGGDDADSDAGEAAQVQDAGGGAEEERAEGADTSVQPLAGRGEPVRSVAGPAADVVRALRREGIPAQVVEGAVVADARAGEVEAALADRADGPIEVYLGD